MKVFFAFCVLPLIQTNTESFSVFVLFYDSVEYKKVTNSLSSSQVDSDTGGAIAIAVQ